MELKNILLEIEGVRAKGNLDLNIKHIKSNSKEVKKDDMFVAIKGYEEDGDNYIQEAVKNGASVIVAQEDVDRSILKEVLDLVTVVLVPNVRIAISKMACNFYKNPSKHFKLIGITGTKGKTTTAYMTKAILEKEGKKVGLIGTIATYIGNEKLEENTRTTPDSLCLQETFYKMAKAKCDVVIMEVSSQSLKLHRVDGSDFDIGVFTNFSEDHISPKEHPNMEDYFNSKVRLFNMCKIAYINADDIYIQKIKKLVPDCEFTTYGIDNYCNLLAKDVTVTNSSVDFRVKLGMKNDRVKTGIPGRYSVYNSLAAISIALKIGCSAESIKEALLEVRVPGRSELVDNSKELTIMIDYAHSPESLQSILETVKSYTKGRVICVFGCGGDRDSTKRPIMGEIAGKLADYTIITSDNPRTEEPIKIIQEIENGIKQTKGNYKCIEDRKEAIKTAIKMANKKDIIVVAGKGHEQYQEIKGEKYPFNEKEIIQKIIEEKK